MHLYTKAKKIFTLVFLFIPFAMQAQTDTVRIVNMTFFPSTLHIKAGATVVWVNTTDMIHTSTSGTGCQPDMRWNSGDLQKNQSFKFTFKTVGSYPYFCIPHCLSGMTGIIVVGEAKA